jgi:hypothetical protein
MGVNNKLKSIDPWSLNNTALWNNDNVFQFNQGGKTYRWNREGIVKQYLMDLKKNKTTTNPMLPGTPLPKQTLDRLAKLAGNPNNNQNEQNAVLNGLTAMWEEAKKSGYQGNKKKPYNYAQNYLNNMELILNNNELNKQRNIINKLIKKGRLEQ